VASALWWLSHILGLDNLSGPWYGFWSGFGSDLGEVTILGALGSLYWKHTCHVDRCWRLGRHPVAGTGFTVCRRHHPHDAPTHQDVLDAHARSQETSP